jgi:hypothetical protein
VKYTVCNEPCFVRTHLKGQSHEIFDTRLFILNGTPDSWAKAVLNIESNWQSNSIRFDAENRLRVMPHSAESIFWLDNARLNILFYCPGAGKITYDRFFDRLLL